MNLLQTTDCGSIQRTSRGMAPILFFRAAALALALLAAPFTAHSQNYTASSDNSTSAITISSGNYTISVGSNGSLTRSNAITLSGGTLQGGIMDNVATVSGLSGAGNSTTNVDANGVTIILRGNGTSATTANLTLASGVSITGANELLVGGGGGGGGSVNNVNNLGFFIVIVCLFLFSSSHRIFLTRWLNLGNKQLLKNIIHGTRFISRNIYSPKIFLRVIVEVFNEILEEKTTNEIKQTDLLVENSAEIYCSNLFRPKRSSTKINHQNVRWIFHRKKQRIF